MQSACFVRRPAPLHVASNAKRLETTVHLQMLSIRHFAVEDFATLARDWRKLRFLGRLMRQRLHG